MAENAADRRAHGVQDAKRLVSGDGHGQNHRSPTKTVSPGLSGVPSGTTTGRNRRIGMGEGDAVAFGAGRETTRDGDRAFDTHVGHVRILSGGCDLAEDEERPVGFDFGGHMGSRI